jgi:hypothetical protein
LRPDLPAQPAAGIRQPTIEHHHHMQADVLFSLHGRVALATGANGGPRLAMARGNAPMHSPIRQLGSLGVLVCAASGCG